MFSASVFLVIWLSNLYPITYISPAYCVLDLMRTVLNFSGDPGLLSATRHDRPTQYQILHESPNEYKGISTDGIQGQNVLSYEEFLKPDAVPPIFVAPDAIKKLDQDIKKVKHEFELLYRHDVKVHDWYRTIDSQLQYLQKSGLSRLESSAHQRLELIMRSLFSFDKTKDIKAPVIGYYDDAPYVRNVEALFQKEGNLIVLELKSIFEVLDQYAGSRKSTRQETHLLQEVILDILRNSFESKLIARGANIEFLSRKSFGNSLKRFALRDCFAQPPNADKFFWGNGMQELINDPRFLSYNLFSQDSPPKTWSGFQKFYLQEYLKSYEVTKAASHERQSSNFAFSSLKGLIDADLSSTNPGDANQLWQAWKRSAEGTEDFIYHLFLFHLFHIIQAEGAKFNPQFSNQIELMKKHLELFQKLIYHYQDLAWFTRSQSPGFQGEVYLELFDRLSTTMIHLHPSPGDVTVKGAGGPTTIHRVLETQGSQTTVPNLNQKQYKKTPATPGTIIISHVYQEKFLKTVKELVQLRQGLVSFVAQWNKDNHSAMPPVFLSHLREELYRLIDLNINVLESTRS